ncbi:MAG: hypothetical protein HFG38_05685 [Eubacterium sp.]|nr:hypothetical protein [Eubacterium sp.]
MKTYDVTITETLQKTVRIHADSLEEAEQKAEDNWNASQYNLDSNHFVGACFLARERVREKNWGDGTEKAR